MKFTLYNIGKTDTGYLQTGIAEYVNRINHFAKFEMHELPGVKNAARLPADILMKKEEEYLLKTIPADDLLVLLDEKGKEYTSVEFSKWLEQSGQSAGKNISFVIGGAYGFSEGYKKRAAYMISLSRMTFTHQMVRLFFLEQFYRGMTILRGMKYHNF